MSHERQGNSSTDSSSFNEQQGNGSTDYLLFRITVKKNLMFILSRKKSVDFPQVSDMDS